MAQRVPSGPPSPFRDRRTVRSALACGGLLGALLPAEALAQDVIWQHSRDAYQLKPKCALLGDVTGDGIADVVVATDRVFSPKTRQFLRVLDGKNGHGVWQVKNTAGQAFFVDTLHPLRADVDGDLLPDLFVTTSLPAEMRTHSGADGVELARAATFDREAWAGVVGDCDGDGKPDIAVTTGTKAPMVIELRDAATLSVFATVTLALPAFATGWGTIEPAGDFDLDGAPDLAVRALGGGIVDVGVYSLADGHALMSFGGTTNDGFGEDIAILDDHDGDGRPELAVNAGRFLHPNGDERGVTSIWSGATSTLLREFVSPHDSPGVQHWRLGPVIGDIDGDGVRDFLVGERELPWHTNGRLPFFVRSGATFEPLFEATEVCEAYEPIAGGADLDGDGIDDFVTIGVVFSDGTLAARRGATRWFSAWPPLVVVDDAGPPASPPRRPGDELPAWLVHTLTTGLAPGSPATLWIVREDGVPLQVAVNSIAADSWGNALLDLPLIPDQDRVYELQASGIDPNGNAFMTPVRRVEFDVVVPPKRSR